MKLGIDLDDVIAECAVPYLRTFAEEYGLELPGEDIGWHTLDTIETVPQAEKDRFRMRLYDGSFFSELEPYADAPEVLERLVAAGHELYFITARAERRRVVTETWLREKGLMRHAKSVHLRPHEQDYTPAVRGRYDAKRSALYKATTAEQLGLDAFCEDDRTIALALAERRIRVFLFDHPWNRDASHDNIERVGGWSDVAKALGV